MKRISPSSISEIASQRNAVHIAMLQELAELSMKLATRAAEEALCDSPSEEHGHSVRGSANARVTFERLSRCVRDTIALKSRLAAGRNPAAGNRTETYADARNAAILAWLAGEIDACHNQRANDGGNGTFCAHDLKPN